MTEKATFGAGCFWGVEAAFRKVPGIKDVVAGFMGGSTESPGYDEVVTGNTGHVEVAQISFDPSRVEYSQLLDLFWLIHDPTQVDRQGNDIGKQYRTVIFYADENQKQLAEKSKSKIEQSGQFDRPIATKIEPAGTFWKAEEYHQNYLEKNPGGYCHVNMGKVIEYIKNNFGESNDQAD